VAIVHVEQSVIGDRHTVRVAADVLQDLVGPGEGWFRIHDPVGLPGGLEMRGKARWISEGLERARAVKLPGVEGLLQRVEKDPTEEPRQDTDRQEESRSTGDPPGAIGREASTGDDTMEMRVMHQGLSPGVGALCRRGEVANLHVFQHPLPKRGHTRLLCGRAWPIPGQSHGSVCEDRCSNRWANESVGNPTRRCGSARRSTVYREAV
jgi:hypothetical protein